MSLSACLTWLSTEDAMLPVGCLTTSAPESSEETGFIPVPPSCLQAGVSHISLIAALKCKHIKYL